MGTKIIWNGQEREVVKVKSDNKDHDGFYTTFRDAMAPGDVELIDGDETPVAKPAKAKNETGAK